MARVFQDPKRFVAGRPAWVLDYRVAGKRKREWTQAQTKKDALALLGARLTSVTKAELTGVPAEGTLVTFREFVEEEYLAYARTTKAASTYASDVPRAKVLMPYFGSLALSRITRGTVQRYLDQRGQEVNRRTRSKIRPATLNRERMFVQSVLAVAKDRGIIQDNPLVGMPQIKENNTRGRYLSQDEVRAILAHCSQELRETVLFALLSGFRKSEVLSLRPSHVNLPQGEVSIVGKGGKLRTIPIEGELARLLAARPKPMNDGVIFPLRDVSHAFKRAARRAGIADVCFHTLRHTYASRKRHAGMPMPALQALLGHAWIQTTMRYAHTGQSELRDAVQKCGSNEAATQGDLFDAPRKEAL